MQHTTDQQLALENMAKWSKSPIKKAQDLLYTLNGAAGTGKSTIAKAFIESLNIPQSKIAVTAPTHKAKKVIQDATGYTAETIQKLLGLRPNVEMDNFNINRPVFAPMAKDTIQDFKIILIDESSMINAAAFDLIIKKSAKYNVRILFMGDAYQLPPVNEKISKVFTGVENRSTLKQVVRQDASNPLTRVLLNLRKDVHTATSEGVNLMLKEQESMIGDTGFKCLDSSEFSTELLNMYRSTEYSYNRNYIKFLAYTNANIEQWSEALRKHLLGEASKNFINVGESLTGYTTIANYKTKEVLLQNSEDYEVTKVERGKSSYGIPGYHVMLEVDGTSSQVFIVDDKDKQEFITIFKEKLNKAKQFKGSYWSTFYNFKNAHLLMHNIYEYGKLIVSKDLYYGYGCTVHKSQGSTYDNVAINLSNINTKQDISERARLIYVALSRTRYMNLILKPKL